MAIEVLKNCKIWVDGYDLSGDHNELAVAYDVDEKEVTTFGQSSHIFAGGLRNAGFSGKGFFDYNGTPPGGEVGDVEFSRIGTTDILTSLGLSTGAEGEWALMMRALHSKLSVGDAIGEINPFAIEGKASSNMVLGTIMHNAVRTATGNGTQRQLGAVSATQKLYAGLHVVGPVTGGSPSLTVAVQSDTSGFPSPTTRATFGAKTAIGSEWITPVAGPITDDFWRVTWTISGSTPSFPFIVVVAIL